MKIIKKIGSERRFVLIIKYHNRFILIIKYHNRFILIIKYHNRYCLWIFLLSVFNYTYKLSINT